MSLEQTPLLSCHLALNAQMMEFGGFNMPLRYGSEKAEHLAVRQNVGVFDISHMGEFFLIGKKAQLAADVLFTNHFEKAKPGQALYTLLLNEQGTILDDLVAYFFSPEKILLCINASNRHKDFAWMSHMLAQHFLPQEATLQNVSQEWALVAVQGPKASSVISDLYGSAFSFIPSFTFKEMALPFTPTYLARTGYTGEDGYEIFIPTAAATRVWEKLMQQGKKRGIAPCGLAARDTLRLEAGFCLYGKDIDETTTPLQAGLNWVVKLDKSHPFVGQAALLKEKLTGITRKRCGLKLLQPGIPRSGYELQNLDFKNIGRITSGTFSPSLGYPIAQGYIGKPHCQIGEKLYVIIRGRPTLAEVVALPFYRQPRKK